MGDRLFATHVHDNHGPDAEVLGSDGYVSPQGIDEHLPPGFGTIPWVGVIAALWRAAYSDTLTFESGPWPGLPEADGFAAAIRFWRTCEHLARRHVVVFVALRDPLLVELTEGEPRSAQHVGQAVIAADLLRDRQLVLKRLARAGVRCIDAQASEVSTRLLNQYLEIRRRELV